MCVLKLYLKYVLKLYLGCVCGNFSKNSKIKKQKDEKHKITEFSDAKFDYDHPEERTNPLIGEWFQVLKKGARREQLKFNKFVNVIKEGNWLRTSGRDLVVDRKFTWIERHPVTEEYYFCKNNTRDKHSYRD